MSKVSDNTTGDRENAIDKSLIIAKKFFKTCKEESSPHVRAAGIMAEVALSFAELMSTVVKEQENRIKVLESKIESMR